MIFGVCVAGFAFDECILCVCADFYFLFWVFRLSVLKNFCFSFSFLDYALFLQGMVLYLHCFFDFYKKLVNAFAVKLLIKTVTGCLYVLSGVCLLR